MTERIGLIGGTGLGDVLQQQLENVSEVAMDTPFGSPSGKILTGTFADKQIAFINRHGARPSIQSINCALCSKYLRTEKTRSTTLSQAAPSAHLKKV